MRELVLSLFPGIGLLDRGFELEGFTVVRGPDLLWGGDVRAFHVPAGRFDGVIGGPPCQAFSRLQALVRHNREKRGDGSYREAPNLIPEFERLVAEAAPAWFLMENVPQAPVAVVPGYSVSDAVLNNRWLGEEQNRVRRFSFGVRSDHSQAVGWYRAISEQQTLFESVDYSPAALAAGGRWVPVAIGGSGKRKRATCVANRSRWTFREHCRLQGLPEDFELPGFTTAEAIRAVGNGVPVPMGRAVARAVRRALQSEGVRCA